MSRALTVKEVCNRLQISRTTLWTLRKERVIKAMRIRSAVRFSEQSVREFEESVTR